jgi:hypothetical protein
MAMLVLTCPATNRDIVSGIDVEPMFLAILPNTTVKFTCPACGIVHAWSKRDCWLDVAGKVKMIDAA